MKRIQSILSVGLLGVTAILTGACAPKQSGLLSDYSNLRRDGRNMRYRNTEALGQYKSFIIEPVTLHFHEGQRPFGMDRTEETRMTEHLRYAVKAAIADAYPIVQNAGPGVARVRLVITGLTRNRAFGSASMEGEVLDSQTGEQIAAIILASESAKASGSETLTDWTRAQAVMDIWAKRMRGNLDAIHIGPVN